VSHGPGELLQAAGCEGDAATDVGVVVMNAMNVDAARVRTGSPSMHGRRCSGFRAMLWVSLAAAHGNEDAIVFKIALEESGETLLTGVVALFAMTLALALSLVLLLVAMDQPWLRFSLIGLMSAVAFFLRRTFAIGPAGWLLGFVPVIVLTLPDFVPTPELMIRLTLWLWPMLSLGIAGAIAANLFLAPVDPAALLREELVSRARAAEAAIARCLGTADRGPEPMRFAISGTGRMLQLLRDAGIVHPASRARSAEQRALIALTDRLATAAAALDVLPHAAGAAERDRLQTAAARCERLRTALEGDSVPGSAGVAEAIATDHGSALLPTLVELETVLVRIEEVLVEPASAARNQTPTPSNSERQEEKLWLKSRRQIFLSKAPNPPCKYRIGCGR